MEMLATAGGLQPTAGRRIRITRRAEYGTIELSSAIKDSDRKVSYVEISLDSLTQNINPAEDIVLKAYDVVTAETAQPIFVAGEVTRPGVVQLGEQPSLSIIQVLAQAGGFTSAASRRKARVLRPIAGTTRRAEIDLDLSRILFGKRQRFPAPAERRALHPRDSVRMILAPMGTSLLTTAPYLIISLAIAGVL